MATRLTSILSPILHSPAGQLSPSLPSKFGSGSRKGSREDFGSSKDENVDEDEGAAAGDAEGGATDAGEEKMSTLAKFTKGIQVRSFFNQFYRYSLPLFVSLPFRALQSLGATLTPAPSPKEKSDASSAKAELEEEIVDIMTITSRTKVLVL